ncbi:MAG TPA: SRPBCC family protein [Ilumatobacteraceae bacterium]|nr:SRPBCC family protein [Ilumatobacteraceae bacterium]
MRLRQIDVNARTTASADAVFRLLADGSTWPNWAPIDSFELERSGDPPPEGVGAIRVFKRGRVTGRDEIVEIVPGRRLGYVSISGLAIKDYRATVDLEDASDGTAINWRASFSPKIPGTGAILQRGIRRFLQQCADGLSQKAARQSS